MPKSAGAIQAAGKANGGVPDYLLTGSAEGAQFWLFTLYGKDRRGRFNESAKANTQEMPEL